MASSAPRRRSTLPPLRITDNAGVRGLSGTAAAIVETLGPELMRRLAVRAAQRQARGVTA